MNSFRYYQVVQHDRDVVATIVESQLHGEMMAELLQHEMLEIADQLSPGVIVMDFTNVTMISTSIVSFLLKINQKLMTKGIPLRLAAMSATLHGIFETMHLDGMFNIVPTVEEALSRRPVKNTAPKLGQLAQVFREAQVMLNGLAKTNARVDPDIGLCHTGVGCLVPGSAQ